MASLKKRARASTSSDSGGSRQAGRTSTVSGSDGSKTTSQATKKEDISTDGVLELSVTIGYLGADVHKDELQKLELLMHDHCDAGVVAIERGDMESHLHFQMVVRARISSARAFGVLCRKYMEWHGIRNMSPVGKVTCKVLSNRLMHTFKGMIGYCLKDCGASHFAVAMQNISDDDVVVGKTLHAIYGRADLKRRVTLTNKNVTDRMYVWFKYRENRQLTATFLTTLTDMIRSGMFMPAASWIIPMSGQGMEARRMKSLWRCIVDPANVDKDTVADVFVRKREFVRGRYYKPDEDDDSSPDSFVSEEQARTPMKSCLKPSTEKVVRFVEEASDAVPCKKLNFSDELGSFIPLYDRADLVRNEFLPTTDVLLGQKQTVVKSEADFWESLTCTGSQSVAQKRTGRVEGKAKVDGVIDVITLSSDDEDEALQNRRKRKLLKLVEDV